MRAALGIIALLALVSACGGHANVTGPPPPPPPGIAQVVLVSPLWQMFTRQAVPGQVFIARVLDSAGAPVPANRYTLTVQASGGWTVRGDTVIAPARETIGAVALTASAPAPQSAAVSTVSVVGVFNLRLLGLVLTPIRCGASNFQVLDSISGQLVRADSALLSPVVDSTRLFSGVTPNDTVSIFSADWHAWVFYAGTKTLWYTDHGVQKTTEPLKGQYPIELQRPDTLWTLVAPTVANPTWHAVPSPVDTSTGLPQWRADTHPWCGFPSDSSFWIKATRLP
jgi:hypothetical protein